MLGSSGYYSHKLAAGRLKQAYEIATPRVRQYLEAEASHVLEKIRPSDLVVELGCGYGRILPRLAGKTKWVIGIDTSAPTLELARQATCTISNCSLILMDGSRLGFGDQVFDCVVCIQNGISAFHVDQRMLINETVRVTRQGGTILFSSYSDGFWQDRLEWFELQSKGGLIGEIDYEKTRNGVIACKDGFTAVTVRREDFLRLTSHLNADVKIVEVDESSLFCEIMPFL
jgi:ubiquinone/menaquinone biosynthesis C-methylase UbiE